jgi:hypothetical protein
MAGRRRSTAVLLGAAALVASQVPGPGHAVPVAQAATLPPAQVHLVLDPRSVTPPATVRASGTCPISSGISEVGIVLDGGDAASAPVDAGTGGFGPVSFAVPEGTEPADHTVTTVADGEPGVCGRAILTVRPPTPTQPTLVLRPEVVTAPGQVTASGTCPPDWADDSVRLFLDGRPVATTTTDGRARFGPVRVPVATGTAPVDHIVRSECGGSAALRVGPPPATTTTPTTSPATPTTRSPARTSTSVPAGPRNGGVPPVAPGAPSRSSPAPSDPPPSGPAQTGPAAPRTAAPGRTTGLPGWLWPVLGLLAGAALVATSVRGLRTRRGRRWVTEHVTTQAAARRPLVPAPAPGEALHGHTVRLHAQRPGWTTPQEVGDAHDRDHRADDGA